MDEPERERARALLARTDSDDRRQVYLAWCELGAHRRGLVPWVHEAFSQSRHAHGRESQIYHVLPYARFDDATVELGLAALRDRRKEVRWRACGLLARSGRAETAPDLEQARRGPTREQAERALATLRDGTPFGADDDPFYFFYGHDPHRAPRGTFADALCDELGAWLEARGFEPSFVFQHTFEYRSPSRVLRVEWDSYDVEARLGSSELGNRAPSRPVPESIPAIAAAIRRVLSA